MSLLLNHKKNYLKLVFKLIVVIIFLVHSKAVFSQNNVNEIISCIPDSYERFKGLTFRDTAYSNFPNKSKSFYLVQYVADSLIPDGLNSSIISNRSKLDVFKTHLRYNGLVVLEYILEDSLKMRFDIQVDFCQSNYNNDSSVVVESDSCRDITKYINLFVNDKLFSIPDSVLQKIIKPNLYYNVLCAKPVEAYYDDSNNFVYLYVFTIDYFEPIGPSIEMNKYIFSLQNGYLGAITVNSYTLELFKCYYPDFIGF